MRKLKFLNERSALFEKDLNNKEGCNILNFR